MEAAQVLWEKLFGSVSFIFRSLTLADVVELVPVGVPKVIPAEVVLSLHGSHGAVEQVIWFAGTPTGEGKWRTTLPSKAIFILVSYST